MSDVHRGKDRYREFIRRKTIALSIHGERCSFYLRFKIQANRIQDCTSVGAAGSNEYETKQEPLPTREHGMRLFRARFQDERSNYLKASNCLRTEWLTGREFMGFALPTGGDGTKRNTAGRATPFRKIILARIRLSNCRTSRITPYSTLGSRIIHSATNVPGHVIVSSVSDVARFQLTGHADIFTTPRERESNRPANQDRPTKRQTLRYRANSARSCRRSSSYSFRKKRRAVTRGICPFRGTKADKDRLRSIKWLASHPEQRKSCPPTTRPPLVRRFKGDTRIRRTKFTRATNARVKNLEYKVVFANAHSPTWFN